jgi:hypothetical protein
MYVGINAMGCWGEGVWESMGEDSLIMGCQLRSSDSLDPGEALDLSDLAQYMRPIEMVHIGEFP